MKTLVVDGQWLLKKNFKGKKALKSSIGTLCGGTIGFMHDLKKVMNKILLDRVFVAWDGFNAGKLRYNIYPPYKESRKKNWENESRVLTMGGTGSPEDMEKMELLNQKILTKNILDELFVRQAEVDYIEADDLIAQYVLTSDQDSSEEIIIFSKDKDFLQLISEKVYIMTSDSLLAFNRYEYEKKYGHTLENELLFKCFEGDKGDDISGVMGITRDTLIKNFPDIAKEKYIYRKLVEESYEAKKDKKKKNRKIYDKVINAEHVLYRNAKLMNLKKPFLNSEAKTLIDIVKHGTLDDDREIISAIALLKKEGLMVYIGEEYVYDFLSPFYMLMSKEKEYSKKMKM
jgi:5'-3' exonuclease